MSDTSNGRDGVGEVATITDLFRDTYKELDGATTAQDVLDRLCAVAVDRVPGAGSAGISGKRRGAYATIAATDQLVRDVDSVQHGLGSGPCVDAMHDEHVYVTGDLAAEQRWPEFGRAAVELGVTSMMSYRLFVEGEDATSALNFYAAGRDAFDSVDEMLVVLLATLGAAALGRAAATGRADNLAIALEHSREIGIAIGILMSTYRITREEGFDILRLFSQRSHRKLADIAAEVADTGALPELPAPAAPARARRRA